MMMVMVIMKYNLHNHTIEDAEYLIFSAYDTLYLQKKAVLNISNQSLKK